MLCMFGHGFSSRLPGSVCVGAVQTLRCGRVHQRHGQLSSSLAQGETLGGPSQEGLPPPTGGHSETEGDRWFMSA